MEINERAESILRQRRRLAAESQAAQDRDAESRRLAALRRDMGWGEDA